MTNSNLGKAPSSPTIPARSPPSPAASPCLLFPPSFPEFNCQDDPEARTSLNYPALPRKVSDYRVRCVSGLSSLVG